MVALSSASVPAFAQQPPRDTSLLPPVVFDARGTIAMLKQSETTADSFGVRKEELPSKGLGVAGGLHFYPLRRNGFAVGLGGELLLTSAHHQPLDADQMPVGRAIRRRLQSLSGQLSLNFGHREGWSYVSGGMGPVAFDTYFDGDIPDGLRENSLNYGGGARWFNRPHLAFTVDVRLYATKPANPTLIVGQRKRQSVMVISAGISIK